MYSAVLNLTFQVILFQNGWCRGPAFRASEVDPLFWKCYVHHVFSRLKWIWSSAGWVGQRGESALFVSYVGYVEMVL